MYKEYQIRASVIAAFKKALATMGVEGYVVIQRNQQTMTHEYDCVIIDKISMKQHGFQARRHMHGKDKDGKVVTFSRQEWIEEWTWQISVAHRRMIDDTIDSLTGEDVANRLRVWLNSAEGARTMRSMPIVPFAPMQTFNLKLRPYKDDSDINQVEAIFDFRMQVVQYRDTVPEWVTNWDWETHPI